MFKFDSMNSMELHSSIDEELKTAWKSRGLELIKLEKSSDIRIRVDNCIFHCHKAILMMASPFFEKLFLTDCKEASSDEIRLESVSAGTFHLFRDYIYTRDEKIFENIGDTYDLLDLIDCANMWLAETLLKSCVKTVMMRIESMEMGLLLQFFVKANLYNIEPLMLCIIESLKDKSEKELICLEAAQLDIHNIEHYMNAVDYLRDFTKFQIIENWIEHCDIRKPATTFPFQIDNEDENKKTFELLNGLLNRINYFNMTFEEFYEGPWKSNIFDDPWKLNIFAATRGIQSYQNTSHGPLVEILGKAHLYNNDSLVKLICEDFESMHGPIDCPQSIALTFECFQIYINCKKFEVSEIERFELIEKWINANLANDINNEIKQKLLDNVSYTDMNLTEYEEGPGMSNLLDGEAKYKHIIQIAKQSFDFEN